MPPRAGCIRAAGWWPATRVADPVFGSITVGLGRTVIAAVLAAVVLITRGERLIVPTLLPRLGIVVLGAVIGFPLLTTLALQNVTSAHAAVVSGLLPAATAGMAVARAGERPRRRYWLALLIGLAAVLGFAAIQGAGRPRMADLLVLAAVVLAGLGFADGATLAREYGGWRVICWALVLTLPVLLPITVISVVLQPPSTSPSRQRLVRLRQRYQHVPRLLCLVRRSRARWGRPRRPVAAGPTRAHSGLVGVSARGAHQSRYWHRRSDRARRGCRRSQSPRRPDPPRSRGRCWAHTLRAGLTAHWRHPPFAVCTDVRAPEIL